MRLPLFSNLKKPTHLFVFLGSFLLFFDVSYYFMSTMPGTQNYMCVIGASLTLPNILFSLVMSALVGIVFSGLLFFLSTNAKRKVLTSSISGFGAILGGLTIFCLPCALPVVSLFGISLSLSFFTSYNLFIKAASLFLLVGTAFILNKKLSIDCERCRV